MLFMGQSKPLPLSPLYPLHSPLHGVSSVRNDVKSNNVQRNEKKVPVAVGWEEQNTKRK